MIHKDWKYADRILRNSFIKFKELDQCDSFTISKMGSLFVLSNMYMKKLSYCKAAWRDLLPINTLTVLSN